MSGKFRDRFTGTVNTRKSPGELTSPPDDEKSHRKNTNFVNAVYYPNWRVYKGQSPGSLNLDSVSHVFYAFAKLDGDGSVILTDEHADCVIPVDGTNGCISAFRKLQREKYPTVKLILSVGGAADSKIFDEMTSDDTRLERFVSTARMLVDVLGMNGIDIDWEHPSNEAQSQQYTSLLARLREALPSPEYLVTTAVPAGVWALRNMNLGEASNFVDMINIMAYDFVGPFTGVAESGHHAQLRCPGGGGEECSAAANTSGEAAMHFLLEQGVARDKIVLGVPLYGRSFLGASGPGQPFDGHGGQEGGIFEFKDLPITGPDENALRRELDIDAITPCAEQFDSKSVAAWCVGPQTEEGGGFITYDNAMSVEAKASFVKDEGLGGLFYWHIGFDKPKGEGSLVDVGGNMLGVGQKKNSWWARYR